MLGHEATVPCQHVQTQRVSLGLLLDLDSCWKQKTASLSKPWHRCWGVLRPHLHVPLLTAAERPGVALWARGARMSRATQGVRAVRAPPGHALRASGRPDGRFQQICRIPSPEWRDWPKSENSTASG